MPKGVLTDALLAEYTRVAYYYYKEDMTQDQIAKCMNMSRQRVNRILRECLERGIVRIFIRESTDIALLELETALRKKYGLLDVRVVDNPDPDEIYFDLGRAAGEYFVSILRDHDVVGVSRGRTLAAMAQLMPPSNAENVTIVQLMGSRNQEVSRTTVNEIVHQFAGKLGAKQNLLFAPLVVGSAAFKQSLLQDEAFQQTYNMIKASTISIVGIGDGERAKVLYAQGGLSMEQMITLSPGQTAVGEVVGHIFDSKGKPIHNTFRDRLVSVELEDYLKIPRRIGVAGLPHKADAIRGAILGKYINILIVDTATAKILCEM